MRTSLTANIWLLACLPLLGSAPAMATPAEEEQIRADCDIEGKAVGLSGADLDDFVEQCIADLLSVELSNPQE